MGTALRGKNVSKEAGAFARQRGSSGASPGNEAFRLGEPDFPVSAIARRFDEGGAANVMGAQLREAKAIGMEMGDGTVAMDDELELLG